ncbi:hypothetical protein BB561_004126 [Smittium simulii]|uniref:Uncharacterized protein n=1 Tax=Smittium simulii TaxID=133385 RepID=A0A2T9YI12_9FUNG|nr:hypothetical protein BB561_004126 [Smittium simulii]
MNAASQTFFDIYDANDFEPIIPMTLMEAMYTIISFAFILGIVFSGLMVIPKNKELVERMIKEEMGDKKKSS